MRQFESINLKSKKTLNINFGDSCVTVIRFGTFNKERQFLWISCEPTEGLTMWHKSEILSELTLNKYLDKLCVDLSLDEKHAMKLFLED